MYSRQHTGSYIDYHKWWAEAFPNWDYSHLHL